MKDYRKILEELLSWIRTQMSNAGSSSAIVGISGGKDSSVVAALMVRALGRENVLGVRMPDGFQNDIDYALGICEHLDIRSLETDIRPITESYESILGSVLPEGILEQTRLNLPPRVRMTMLYAISQSVPGSLVINTSNLSEDWVGYATVYGDTAGAFSPLGMLTTEEVIELGRLLEIPEKFLVKPPSDGLTGRTDEDVLGVTYPQINRYIRTGQAEEAVRAIIDRKHRISRFKFLPIPMFDPALPIVADDIAGVYRKKDKN